MIVIGAMKLYWSMEKCDPTSLKIPVGWRLFERDPSSRTEDTIKTPE